MDLSYHDFRYASPPLTTRQTLPYMHTRRTDIHILSTSPMWLVPTRIGNIFRAGKQCNACSIITDILRQGNGILASRGETSHYVKYSWSDFQSIATVHCTHFFLLLLWHSSHENSSCSLIGLIYNKSYLTCDCCVLPLNVTETLNLRLASATRAVPKTPSCGRMPESFTFCGVCLKINL